MPDFMWKSRRRNVLTFVDQVAEVLPRQDQGGTNFSP